MSLHALATNMASKGRNGDSMLVHMTPGEVHGLQALAMKHGGSLTTNPDTGLPEANFLKSLLPMLAGFALNTFVPGLGAAVGGMFGASAAVGTGIAVGGLTGLATGSLSKGLMAGLGAYGGAGLSEGLLGAGAASGAGQTLATEAATQAGLEGITLPTDYASLAAKTATPDQIAAARAAATPGDLLSAGAKSAAADPMAFAKANFKPLAAAAAPIMADMMVPTTTKASTPVAPGRIREKRWDGRQFVDVASTDANVYNTSGRSFSDLYRGYNNGGIVALAAGGMSGMFDFAQRSKPVVRMSRGGVAHFEEGGGVSYDYGVGGGDAALAAYQAGNYGEASRLLGEAGMGAQDVVSKYGLSQADAATVAQNLGDMGGIQYAAPAAAAPTPTYFTQNPDVATAFTQNSYGMTPEQFAQTHYTNYGQSEGRTFGDTNTAVSTPVVDTGGGLAALNTIATNTGANTDIKFGPGDDLVNLVNAGGIKRLPNAAATPYYFQVNPDVAAEYARNPLGLTPEQFAQVHYDKYGKTEGREFTPSAAVNYATANKTDLVANTLKWIDTNPFATPDQINAAIKGSGMSTGDVNRALDSLVASGKISGSERYYIQQGKGLSAMGDSTAKWLKDNPNATQTQIDAVLKAASMDTGDAQQVLAHGFQVADKDLAAATKYIQDNPDVARWITSDQGKAYIKEHPEFDAKDIAFTHYKRYGEKEGRKFGVDTVKPPVVTPPVVTPPVTYNTAGTNVSGGLESVLGLPPGVSGAGITTVNPNGTITTSPRIPGIPVGGFTGMTSLRDAYTKGGGSLGYTSPKFDKIEDFNAKYVDKRLTGDSKAAYDYLTGKAGATYPTKSSFAGQLSQDYATAVLGYPARGNLPYIYNKATGKMDPNPDYVAPGRDAAGNVTYSMSLNDIKKSLTDAPLSGQALYDFAISNNLSAQQIADATGRSLSSVYSDFRAGSKAATDKTTDAAKGGDTIQVTDSSGYNTETVTATKQADGTYLGSNGKKYDASGKEIMAMGGTTGYAIGGGLGSLGSYSDGGRLLRGPGDGVSDSIPATIGRKQQPARLADGEFVVPARIVSELGNGSTDAGARKLYAMMDRVQKARGKTTGKNKVAANPRADKYLPA